MADDDSGTDVLRDAANNFNEYLSEDTRPKGKDDPIGGTAEDKAVKRMEKLEKKLEERVDDYNKLAGKLSAAIKNGNEDKEEKLTEKLLKKKLEIAERYAEYQSLDVLTEDERPADTSGYDRAKEIMNTENLLVDFPGDIDQKDLTAALESVGKRLEKAQKRQREFHYHVRNLDKRIGELSGEADDAAANAGEIKDLERQRVGIALNGFKENFLANIILVLMGKEPILATPAAPTAQAAPVEVPIQDAENRNLNDSAEGIIDIGSANYSLEAAASKAAPQAAAETPAAIATSDLASTLATLGITQDELNETIPETLKALNRAQADLSTAKTLDNQIFTALKAVNPDFKPSNQAALAFKKAYGLESTPLNIEDKSDYAKLAEFATIYALYGHDLGKVEDYFEGDAKIVRPNIIGQIAKEKIKLGDAPAPTAGSTPAPAPEATPAPVVGPPAPAPAAPKSKPAPTTPLVVAEDDVDAVKAVQDGLKTFDTSILADGKITAPQQEALKNYIKDIQGLDIPGVGKFPGAADGAFTPELIDHLKNLQKAAPDNEKLKPMYGMLGALEKMAGDVDADGVSLLQKYFAISTQLTSDAPEVTEPPAAPGAPKGEDAEDITKDALIAAIAGTQVTIGKLSPDAIGSTTADHISSTLKASVPGINDEDLQKAQDLFAKTTGRSQTEPMDITNKPEDYADLAAFAALYNLTGGDIATIDEFYEQATDPDTEESVALGELKTHVVNNFAEIPKPGSITDETAESAYEKFLDDTATFIDGNPALTGALGLLLIGEGVRRLVGNRNTAPKPEPDKSLADKAEEIKAAEKALAEKQTTFDNEKGDLSDADREARQAELDTERNALDKRALAFENDLGGDARKNNELYNRNIRERGAIDDAETALSEKEKNFRDTHNGGAEIDDAAKEKFDFETKMKLRELEQERRDLVERKTDLQDSIGRQSNKHVEIVKAAATAANLPDEHKAFIDLETKQAELSELKDLLEKPPAEGAKAGDKMAYNERVEELAAKHGAEGVSADELSKPIATIESNKRGLVDDIGRKYTAVIDERAARVQAFADAAAKAEAEAKAKTDAEKPKTTPEKTPKPEPENLKTKPVTNNPQKTQAYALTAEWDGLMQSEAELDLLEQDLKGRRPELSAEDFEREDGELKKIREGLQEEKDAFKAKEQEFLNQKETQKKTETTSEKTPDSAVNALANQEIEEIDRKLAKIEELKKLKKTSFDEVFNEGQIKDLQKTLDITSDTDLDNLQEELKSKQTELRNADLEKAGQFKDQKPAQPAPEPDTRPVTEDLVAKADAAKAAAKPARSRWNPLTWLAGSDLSSNNSGPLGLNDTAVDPVEIRDSDSNPITPKAAPETAAAANTATKGGLIARLQAGASKRWAALTEGGRNLTGRFRKVDGNPQGGVNETSPEPTTDERHAALDEEQRELDKLKREAKKTGLSRAERGKLQSKNDRTQSELDQRRAALEAAGKPAATGGDTAPDAKPTPQTTATEPSKPGLWERGRAALAESRVGRMWNESSIGQRINTSISQTRTHARSGRTSQTGANIDTKNAGHGGGISKTKMIGAGIVGLLSEVFLETAVAKTLEDKKLPGMKDVPKLGEDAVVNTAEAYVIPPFVSADLAINGEFNEAAAVAIPWGKYLGAGLAGGAAGAQVGALIGTSLGPVGTAAGGIVGGVVGGFSAPLVVKLTDDTVKLGELKKFADNSYVLEIYNKLAEEQGFPSEFEVNIDGKTQTVSFGVALMHDPEGLSAHLNEEQKNIAAQAALEVETARMFVSDMYQKQQQIEEKVAKAGLNRGMGSGRMI